jgi:protein ImuB
LRENLARMPLPAPTLELRLGCRDLVFSEAPSGELFPTRASEQEGLLRLVERLQARLGREQVLGMQRVADHRPERATRLLPLEPAQLDTAAGTAGAPVGPAPAPSAMPLTRPVWLLPQAQPLADRQSAPWLDGRPLQVLAGPERIETGWWDGEPAVRDYFIAQAHDGTLVWIFRPRLPATTQGSGWFLHGRFA